MPTFPAHTPVTVTVDLAVGTLHVVAGERDDLVVTVLPADPGKAADARSAQETEVVFAGDVLTVNGPRTLKQHLLGPRGTVCVTVETPAGSSLTGKVSAGSLFAEGPLGTVDVNLSAGNARIDEAARLDLRLSAGSAVVGRTGPASIRAGAGAVRVREITGDATIRSSNGHTTVGTVTGALEVWGAHGEIAVDRMQGALTARTSSGGIRVDAVESGTLDLTTSYGSVEVGVPEGTAAHLDASTRRGTVRNLLTPGAGPMGDEPTVEVHATTGYGDIVIRRPEGFPTTER